MQRKYTRIEEHTMKDEIEQIKNMNEIWTFISRQRRRIGITNKISLQEWRKYFVKLIQGERQNIQKERNVGVLTLILAWEWAGRKDHNEERTGSKEDPNKKVRKGKTTGEDLSIKIMTRITNLMNRVWMFEGLPERWKEVVVEKKLNAELERKRIIAKTQASFSSGRSTIDNAFILNYEINIEIKEKGESCFCVYRRPRNCCR